jgi:predicted flap endonuclease-1-like 5' DNA nuclease
LDDFTAIPGVGPVTAQKLHDLGLFTYDDIREWEGHLDDHLPHHVAFKIQQWLDKHLT